MSRVLFFQIFFITILLMLILFEFIIYKRWSKRIIQKSYKKIFFWAYWSIAIFSKMGFIILLFSRSRFYIEIEGFLKPIYYFLLSWNYAFFFSFLFWIISFSFLYVLYYIFSKFNNKPSEKQSTYSVSRKAFLTSSAAMLLDTTPFLAAGMNFSGMYLGSKDFVVFSKKIKIDGLDPVFSGFRIVQISDIHVGSLINDTYLKPTLEMISSLKPDVIAVTGDILDNSRLYLPIVGWYFQKLNEIAPVYAVLGNHDHIDLPSHLIKTLKQTNTHILVNEYSEIKKGKSTINLIGLDYPIQHFESKKTRSQFTEEYFESVYKNLPKKDQITIVLNHHPSEFEILKNKPIHLVLAGHTHGGQIMLSENRESSLSLASNFLKYYVDLYTENGVYLYVNRGLGHWFPLRINCPPEITLLELY